MAILQYIDQLNEMLEQAQPVPLSSLRMVNAAEFAQRLEQMRLDVPGAIRESERVLAEREQILAQARSEAERLVVEAQEQARQMLQNDPMIGAAQREAERIVNEGRRQAAARTAEADAYALQVLQHLSATLRNAHQQVDNGARVLSEAGATPPDSSPPMPRNGKTPAAAPRARAKHPLAR